MKRLYLSFICFSVSFISCEPLNRFAFDEDANMIDDIEGPSYLADGLKPYAESFRKAFDSCSEKEAFLFFTDPHLLNANNEFNQADQYRIKSYFTPVKVLYDELPLSFCLCGGDWLNNGDTQKVARQKLLYIDQQMRYWFSPYYKMYGNHDTNYQGIISNSDSSRGDLPLSFVEQEYFSETGKAYYSFKGQNTVFFILDSGLDWVPAMDGYRWEQIDWLAEQLSRNTEKHIVIGLHMYFNGQVANNNPMPFSSEITTLCSAFNNREYYSVNGKTYNYAEASGMVHALIAGHNHIDYCVFNNGIPCIGTLRFIRNDTVSFDLFLLNYDQNVLETVRIGSGKSRTINLAS